MAAKGATGFSCSLGFYLWGPNENRLVAHLCSQTARGCAVADARLPTTVLLFFPLGVFSRVILIWHQLLGLPFHSPFHETGN